MNNQTEIRKAFDHGKALIGFVTGGDPNMETCEEIIVKMAQGGCDLIEIGIPFSDPIAEGEVIQKADLRALAAGTTTDRLFELAANVRKKTAVPLVFFTYVNPVFRYGYDRFCRKCEESGINGLIIPDVPYEEKGELLPFAKAHNIEIISLIAPASEQRIEKLASHAEGFVYVVSSAGIREVQEETGTELDGRLDIIRRAARVPSAIELDASTPKQAAHIAQLADGVIAETAIVRLVEQYGEAAVSYVYDYVKQMKQAIS